MNSSAVIRVKDLKKYFPVRKGVFGRTVGHVHAVDGVSFDINEVETLGLVGESGCGKSTVGRTLIRLLEPTSGSIYLGNDELTHLHSKDLRPHRKKMQMIFQDPFASLDPRMTARDIVGELLDVHDGLTRKEKDRRVAELFERVGLRSNQMDNYPHEFSGGQRQRLGIARALSLRPQVIICDEPVSALDVSIQAQVVNLLAELQAELGLSYLFISHDLAVVKHISHRVAIMYLGRIVEIGTRRDLFENPQHPYTESLLSAVPIPDPKARRKVRVLQGDVPSPINRPKGCHFHTRCPYATDRCEREDPVMHDITSSHAVACHLR
ncbi:MAG: peptide ABC transporter substrate-binding protein [Gammaproteobacteria bacterium]|nr:peptide ABC transporter substrate-binding protein [Gammaproteobacteria bacterium]HAO54525.1 peptide ABC transporter substrate-binding protein [Gammaproteobacteria bacterium]